MTRRATYFRPVPVVAATALAAASGAWMAWTPLAGAETRPNEIADLVEHTSPAVVTVLATHAAEMAQDMPGVPGMQGFEGSPFDELLRRFGIPEMGPNHGNPMQPGPQGPQQGPQGGVAVGSGFVIDATGYIVTNDHVVDDATKVKVRFADDREFDAKVIGTDEQTDLALLKIEAEGLPMLALGDSEAMRVGEDVIAVGNPFGLGGTVTRGIVSAMGRDINAGPYVDFIQTDAAINRGNSGGPLLNLEGQVIGVNSAIYSPNGGSVGVGFAIPSNTVEAVVAQLRDGGSVERGWLGVSIQPMSADIATALGLDAAKGALVADVVADSPAAGKLQTGDVILALNGEAVETSRDLPRLVAAVTPDKDATLDILRAGKNETVMVKLGRLDPERSAALDPAQENEGDALDHLGATLSAITPTARERLGLDDDVDGVVVTSLDGDGVAAEAGMQVGDVILQVGGQSVRTPADVEKMMEQAATNAVLFQVERSGAKLFLGIRAA